MSSSQKRRKKRKSLYMNKDKCEYRMPEGTVVVPPGAIPQQPAKLPRIVKPLRFIKANRPHVYTASGTLRSPDLDEAMHLHRIGDTAGLQRLAQRIWAENNGVAK